MERIRQALEQATIDRSKSGAENRTPVPPPAGDAGVAPVAPRKSASPKLHASEVVYTETRSVDVPRSTFEENYLVAGLDGHELQDTYRLLRTRITKEMRANGWRVIAVTGAHQGAGKTTTAINLAIAMAMDVSNTVLLVDADLRNPSIHKRFGYEPEVGLSDYLLTNGGVEVKDMLFNPPVDRMVVMPGREEISNSGEMLGSPQAQALGAELKDRYDDRIIVLDLPPVLSSDDVIMSGDMIDCVLLVAESGQTTRKDMKEAFRLLKDIPVIGTVLNKAPKSKKKAGY